tara:strand:- start:899 stop:1309 length:411 start_codon:yes stop_codon:yes gene_type:complete
MQLDLFGNGTPAPASNGDAHRNQHSQHTPSNSNPYPPFWHNAPDGTSDAAAAMIAPHSSSMRSRVHRAIIDAGKHGLTDDEGEQLLGMIPQTYTPRRGELRKMGVVRDSGNRRNTRRGRATNVWVAIDLEGDAVND